MRYSFNPLAEPGSRVMAVDVWDDASEAYVPIDSAARYQLATNNFIANGGDDFAVFAVSSERYDTGWLLSDALAKYLDDASPISPIVENRISQEVIEDEVEDVEESES